jgi:adenosylcobinamide-phosphate synthase
MVMPSGPGPLALAWAFKASSTLDSMLGYRTGRLRWLGTAGARLDDLLTWLPCRLVMLTLPLVCPPWTRWMQRVQAAERDGATDPSPNAGRSEAIYGHCIGIQLGGENHYGERRVQKPVLAADQPAANSLLVRGVLKASDRLEILWLSALVIIQLVITQ